jgi:leucyl/phenylalanyl-tRNA---protein transferase
MSYQAHIPFLKKNDAFRDPSEAREDGLVALGGDLGVERLLVAYRSGIFPWSANPISWWSPNPRGIIELENFHVSRSTSKKMKLKEFRFSINEAFSEVIVKCAEMTHDRRDNWIEQELIDAYIQLHLAGYAHSAECWCGNELIGGVYGVAIGGFFAGESMFSRVSDGSKMALTFLIDHLKKQGFILFDTQIVTPHTKSLGAIEISRIDYLERLSCAINHDCLVTKK